MKRITLIKLTVIVLVLVSVGCAQRRAFTRGTYQDPNTINLLSDKFSESDLQLIAKKMVNSLNESRLVKEFGAKKPLLIVGKMRNKTDEEIKAIVAAGGIIGVTPVKHFITKGDNPCVEDLIKHINHIRNLVGIDYVGLSKDAIVNGWLPTSCFYPGEDLSRPDWMKVVALELYTKHGYTEVEIKKVIGGNFRRILISNLPD